MQPCHFCKTLTDKTSHFADGIERPNCGCMDRRCAEDRREMTAYFASPQRSRDRRYAQQATDPANRGLACSNW